MTYKQSGPAFAFGDIVQFTQALFLKFGISNGQDFIEQKDVRADVHGHGEAKAHEHAGRVGHDRLVGKLVEPGEADDLAHVPPPKTLG